MLLIEDDPATREAFAEGLSAAGFEVATASEASAALEAIAHVRFDVIVSDYRLPSISGMELLTALRHALPGIPMILYSGVVGDEELAGADTLGVCGILRKPVSLPRLIDAIRTNITASPSLVSVSLTY